MKNRLKFRPIQILSKAALLFVLLVLCCVAFAQNTISGGIAVNINTGTSVFSDQSLAVNTGGSLTVSGTLILKGDLINQNTSGDFGSGTIEFSGTSEQHISGNNTLGNLTLNNASGLTLQGNTTVNSTLSLTNGLLNLGNNHLLIGSSGSISGVPSASKMVVATGLGEMRKEFAGTGSFTFPVGDNTGTTEYSPVTITHTGGTFAPGNYSAIRLINSAYPGSETNYLNRYWFVNQNGITNPVYNAVFQYLPADVVGLEGGLDCVFVEPGLPVHYNITDSTLHQLSATAVTESGVFTGWQAPDKTLNLNLFLEGLYAGSGTMRKAQGSSGDQFSGNIADRFSVELHQGTNYPVIAYTGLNIDLTTTGTALLAIPPSRYGSYYITVKHRNSVAVTTTSPVSFSGNTVTYNFDTPIKAFDNNLKQMTDGQYVVYGGNVNGDGAVDETDIIQATTAAHSFTTGYVNEDVNGDGIVDAYDLILPDNNAANFVSAKHP